MIHAPLYLAPINSLGNLAFRSVCIDSGVDFVFTEMINVEKLIKGVDYQVDKLKIPEDQQNITVVQIVCEDASNILSGVKAIIDNNPFVREINYNMCCPQSSLCKRYLGGGILRNPDKVFEVAKLLKKACMEYGVVSSIKIRLGVFRDDMRFMENVSRIRDAGINKIYVHGRYLDDTYEDPASYVEIAKIKEEFSDMIVIANGDVKDSASLVKIIDETNCDGVMVGRAALNNPGIFSDLLGSGCEISKNGVLFEDRISVIRDFFKSAVFYKLPLDKVKANLFCMTKGVIGASKFRKKLNDVNCVEDIYSLI